MSKEFDLGINPGGPAPVHLAAVAPPQGNGATLAHTKNAGVFTQESPKTGPATLYGLWVDNTQAAIVHVQIFNKLTANVTPGTTVPDFEVACPASVGLLVPLPPMGLNLDVGFTVFCSTASHGGTGSNAGVSLTYAYK